VAGLRLKLPDRPYVSNLTGTWAEPNEVSTPDYWVRHLRETVRFSEGIATLLEREGRVLVEVGPGHALSSLARSQGRKDVVAIPTLRHPKQPMGDLETAITGLGRLWIAGVDV